MIPLRDDVSKKSFSFITWLLIGANIYVFIKELRLVDSSHVDLFIRQWAVIPAKLWSNVPKNWTTLLSSAFLHAGWMHIIGNMLFLFVFGPSVEDKMGHVRYLFFYLAMAIFANAVQAYMMAKTSIPLLGASGAIAGVLGAYFFYFPYARILTLIPIFIFSRIIEIPAFVFLGLWFVFQAWQGAGSIGSKAMMNSGGIAWWAHASGFVAGLILSPALSGQKSKR